MIVAPLVTVPFMAQTELREAQQAEPANRAWQIVPVVAGVVALGIVMWSLYTNIAFIDVEVYVRGARAFLDGQPIYDDNPNQLPFIYPPFAALVFLPLGVLPGLATAIVTVTSLAALARTSWLLATHAPGLLPKSTTLARACGIFAGLAVLEPTIETLRLGQVGLILLWLVAEDLLGDHRSIQGALVGFGTAVKLVPGIFLPFYVLIGRIRAAIVGGLVFAASIAIGFVFLPTESAQYWLEDAFSSSRLPSVEYIANQSFLGAWSRGGGQSGAIWFLFMMVTIAALLIVGAWMWRRDEQLLAFGTVSLAGLLASPISWTHHWVAMFPLLVGLAAHWASRWVRVPLVLIWLVLVVRVVWHLPVGEDVQYSGYQWLMASSYTIVGLVSLVMAIVLVARKSGQRRPCPQSDTSTAPAR